VKSALVVASNRGPVQFGRGLVRRGAGGLIAAVGPAFADGDGIWIAAAISGADRAVAARHGVLRVFLPEGETAVRLLITDAEAYDAHYNEICNRVLWPLNHYLFDLPRGPRFDYRFRVGWEHYRAVNRQFARACADAAEPGGAVFVQDYHLALAPERLRHERPDLGIAHYTHCPWPDPHYFSVLPTARELINGMLGADLLCFEVPRWSANFLRCCAALGYVTGPASVRAPDGRTVRIRSYPLGVDTAGLRRAAAGPEVAARRAELERAIGDVVVLVRVDRLEPAKNLLRGLHAYEALLERRPGLRGRVVHLVLAYASRETVPEYRAYAAEVGQAATAINERYGTPDWRPVHLATDDDYSRSLAAMTLADVFVVNPMWDGQNLVAKEGPAINERDAPLILSRNAGAADDLARGALLVNPFDTAELTDAMVEALEMSPAERAERAATVRDDAGRIPPVEWFARQRGDLADAVGGTAAHYGAASTTGEKRPIR
jgi:trehalose 6-phosphate synthase